MWFMCLQRNNKMFFSAKYHVNLIELGTKMLMPLHNIYIYGYIYLWYNIYIIKIFSINYDADFASM